jgi:hypothetical protein
MNTKDQKQAKPTHTPGPWNIIEDKNFHGEVYYHAASADTNVGSLFVRKADARLIAAAPDLLAALVDAKFHFDAHANGFAAITKRDAEILSANIAAAILRATEGK